MEATTKGGREMGTAVRVAAILASRKEAAEPASGVAGVKSVDYSLALVSGS